MRKRDRQREREIGKERERKIGKKKERDRRSRAKESDMVNYVKCESALEFLLSKSIKKILNHVFYTEINYSINND